MSPSKRNVPKRKLAFRITSVAAAVLGMLGTVNCGGAAPSDDETETPSDVATVEEGLAPLHETDCPSPGGGSGSGGGVDTPCDVGNVCGKCFVSNAAVTNGGNGDTSCGSTPSGPRLGYWGRVTLWAGRVCQFTWTGPGGSIIVTEDCSKAGVYCNANLYSDCPPTPPV